MQKIIIAIILLILHLLPVRSETILLEAESFENKGGWVVDQQFMDIMGSPYLMAHGLGIPVEDASAIVDFPETGQYYLYVRTRNWTAPWSDAESPGKCQVLLDGKPIGKEFGNE